MFTLSFRKFTLSFGRLRQSIVLKCVPHVQYDNFSPFNQSDDCFLASSLPLPSSLYIIRRVYLFIYLFIFLFIYYILLGRILQLPRGKGHKRTSRSYSKVPHLTHPPPPPFAYERQPQHRDHPSIGNRMRENKIKD